MDSTNIFVLCLATMLANNGSLVRDCSDLIILTFPVFFSFHIMLMLQSSVTVCTVFGIMCLLYLFEFMISYLAVFYRFGLFVDICCSYI